MKLKTQTYFIILFFFCTSETLGQYVFPKEALKHKSSSLKAISNTRFFEISGKTEGHTIVDTFTDTGEFQSFILIDSIGSAHSKPNAIKVMASRKVIDSFHSNSIDAYIGYWSIPDSFRQKPYWEIPHDQYPFQHLWVTTSSGDTLIDSLAFNYLDKAYDIKISYDERYLICNPYTSRNSSYDAELDGYFTLYSLADSSFKATKYQCDQCINTFVVGDTILFQQNIPLTNGFDGTTPNIYRASLLKPQDTILVARETELVQMSPNGEYLLGRKQLFGRPTIVIVNARTQKFQYILGRDYQFCQSFFNSQNQTFAFNFENFISYISIPQKFPFDATKLYKRYWSKSEIERFWKDNSLSPSIQK